LSVGFAVLCRYTALALGLAFFRLRLKDDKSGEKLAKDTIK
jgi:hypothetical protein